MVSRRRWHNILFFLLLGVVVAFPLAASGQDGVRVAVMPLEDLSRGQNGYNPGITEVVADVLRQRGVEVLSQEEVIRFLVKNRIRWLGYLDSVSIGKLAKEFKVDYVVLGSINQLRERRPAALGVSLQLVRAQDAKIVWAGGGELCRSDVTRVLGLGEPQGFADIREMVTKELLARLPRRFGEEGAGKVTRLVESAQFLGQVRKPGEEIACRVRFTDPEAPECEQAVLLVGDKEIPFTYRKRDHYFEAIWEADALEGRYPVVLKVPGSSSTEEIFLGDYLVDARPPRFDLQFSGPRKDGRPLLVKELEVVPLLREPEPVERWEVKIVDNEGAVLMTGDGKGLPDRLLWRGQNNQGGLVPDGIYVLIMKLWDKAGNSAAVSREIEVLRRQPEVEVRVEIEGQTIKVELEPGGKVPLSSWKAKVLDQEGLIVVHGEGESFPAALRFPLPPPEKEGKYRFWFVVKDVYGNRLERTLKDLARLARDEENDASAEGAVEEEVISGGWSDDF